MSQPSDTSGPHIVMVYYICIYINLIYFPAQFTLLPMRVLLFYIQKQLNGLLLALAHDSIIQCVTLCFYLWKIVIIYLIYLKSFSHGHGQNRTGHDHETLKTYYRKFSLKSINYNLSAYSFSCLIRKSHTMWRMKKRR